MIVVQIIKTFPALQPILHVTYFSPQSSYAKPISLTSVLIFSVRAGASLLNKWAICINIWAIQYKFQQFNFQIYELTKNDKERRHLHQVFHILHTWMYSSMNTPPGSEPATSCYQHAHQLVYLLFFVPQPSPALPSLSHATFLAVLEAGIHSVFAAAYKTNKEA